MKLNQLITLTRELRTRRLTLTGYAILSILEEKSDWVHSYELLEPLGISYKLAIYLTKALEKSDKGGLVVRERGTDKRYLFFCLTEQGYHTLAQIRTALA